MKALALYQPFPSLIQWGFKTLETRGWKTYYRGPLLITATQKPWPEPFPSTVKICDRLNIKERIGCDVIQLAESDPCGVAICLVDLVDCRQMVKGDDINACIAWSPDRFVFQLENPRPVKHTPVRGQQRFFNVPDELIEFTTDSTHSPKFSCDCGRESMCYFCYAY